MNALSIRKLLTQLLSKQASSESLGPETTGALSAETSTVGLRSSVAESSGISILGSVDGSFVSTGELTINVFPSASTREQSSEDGIVLSEQDASQLLSILQRLITNQQNKSNRQSTPEQRLRLPVPPVNEAHIQALRMIALCPLPLSSKEIACIFPETRWNRICRELIRHGWLRESRDRLVVLARVKRWLERDADQMAKCRKAWISKLRPLKAHPDTGLMLGLMYIRRRHFDKAVIIFCDIADSLEPSRVWNSLYLKVLKMMQDPRIEEHLNPESIVRLYNSTGLCLAHLRRWRNAVTSFLQLHRYSARVNNVWCIGQSYINIGVVYYKTERHDLAEKSYRKAVAHARRTHDTWLLGRALHNLGLTVLNRDSESAMRFLEESIAAKVSAGDAIGAVYAIVGQAMALEVRKNTDQCIENLKVAEQLARATDLRHLRCLILSDLGRIHSYTRNYAEAFRCYQEARKIASEEQFDHDEELILAGEAAACVNANDLERAEDLYRELLARLSKYSGAEQRISALYNIGVVRYKRHNAIGARESLLQAFDLALQLGAQKWLYLCRYVEAMTFMPSVDRIGPSTALRRFAKGEERATRYESAGQLWTALCRRMIEQSKPEKSIIKTAAHAEKCFGRIESRSGLIDVQKLIYVWRRDTGRNKEALSAARQLVKVTKNRSLMEEHARALDEQAVCLQKLLRYREAELLHRRSLRLAQQIGCIDCIKASLNNLAELLRKTGKPKSALRLFQNLAKLEDCDTESSSWISSSINHALALYEAGRLAESDALLRQCERRARRRGLWPEVVRAVHTRANHAWMNKDVRGAENLYLKAIDFDQKHGKTSAGHDAAINFTTFVLQRIADLWREKRPRAATAAFSRAREICDKYNLSVRRAELHIQLGDQLWNGEGNCKLEALKMYLAAMDSVVNVDMVEFFRIGIRATHMVLHLDLHIRIKRIASLEKGLRRWLAEQSEANLDEDTIGFALWPLRAARLIAGTYETREKVSPKVYVRIIQDEIFRSIQKLGAEEPKEPEMVHQKS